MKKQLLIAGLALLSLTMVTTSCSKDDNSTEQQIVKSDVTVTLKHADIKTYKEVTVEILEVNSGKKIEKILKENSLAIQLDRGSYKIAVNGTVVLSNDEQVQIGGNKEVNINSAKQEISIDLVIKSFNEDFIIEEVFFTGVKTLEGKNYLSGTYFKLTNNTDKVLKTGGLLILQSEFNTSLDHKVTPNIVNEAFAVQAILMVPNEISKDVQPGDFVVIADMAMNHYKTNVPAFDLSNADYEYPNLDNPKLGHVDNPAVPNAEVIYTQMAFNLFFLHNRGYESWAIARFPEGVTKDTWLTEYKHEYSYINAANRETKKSTMKIPNEWIIDGVNSCAIEKWEHNPLGASIDSGWTGCGRVDSDPMRYGKTIRRKVVGKMANGKNLYKDTNNSTVDFERDSPSSFVMGIVH
ncbi:MAG: DUF4876 domain-containing protein [Flavobacteriaceae bacterium]|jgi:hypothetical protein|nr:DUF4876 domain-containing protein [Flavobacteriaceae bacterium]